MGVYVEHVKGINMLPANKGSASRLAIGRGKRVRRARNIVKRYAGKPGLEPKLKRRLARAQAVILEAALLDC